jgi:hypothetical protein
MNEALIIYKKSFFNWYFFRDSCGVQENDLSEPLVTFPEPDTPPPVTNTIGITNTVPSQFSSLNTLNTFNHLNSSLNLSNIPNITNHPTTSELMKFEQKKVSSASKTKVYFDYLILLFLKISFNLKNSKHVLFKLYLYFVEKSALVTSISNTI